MVHATFFYASGVGPQIFKAAAQPEWRESFKTYSETFYFEKLLQIIKNF